MKTNRLITLIAGLTLAALVFAGCEKTGDTNTSSSNTSVAANGNANLPPSAPIATATVNSNMPANNSTTNEVPGRRASKDPEPKIGAGGSDFSLFTLARAALNADGELKTSNIVVDIKDGNATLTGNIASAEQKSRAEQLVRAVAGIKSVKNQLNISDRNAKR
jgi:osmotically-inducible protein OsmY